MLTIKWQSALEFPSLWRNAVLPGICLLMHIEAGQIGSNGACPNGYIWLAAQGCCEERWESAAKKSHSHLGWTFPFEQSRSTSPAVWMVGVRAAGALLLLKQPSTSGKPLLPSECSVHGAFAQQGALRGACLTSANEWLLVFATPLQVFLGMLLSFRVFSRYGKQLGRIQFGIRQVHYNCPCQQSHNIHFDNWSRWITGWDEMFGQMCGMLPQSKSCSSEIFHFYFFIVCILFSLNVIVTWFLSVHLNKIFLTTRKFMNMLSAIPIKTKI